MVYYKGEYETYRDKFVTVSVTNTSLLKSIEEQNSAIKKYKLESDKFNANYPEFLKEAIEKNFILNKVQSQSISHCNEILELVENY